MSLSRLDRAEPSDAANAGADRFGGSLTALVTPFADGGRRLDERAFAGLVEWQVAEGTEGLVVAGTTGEAPTLTAGEHDRLLRIAVEAAAGRVPVIAGTGTNCTRSSIELTRAAQAAGAEAIRHQDDVSKRVERTIVERVFVEESVRDMGLETPDSHANFSWIDLGDADEGEVVSALGDSGVVVRPGTPLGGPGHIRVSYGTREQNQRFVDGLAAALG